ncbi:MAG: nitroreductase family protein [Jatrophihabitantaceae bacterium]
MTGTEPAWDDDEPAHLGTDAVLAALDVAVRAPSIHNTQPWRWRLAGDRLTLSADRSRQLPVIDPDGHSLLISCGAALYLSEIALRAAGCPIRTTVLPDPSNPNLLATTIPTARDTQPRSQASEQVAAALRRRCDRRPFTGAAVSQDHLELLRRLGSDSHARVDFPDRADRHVELAVAVSWADRTERNDKAYLAELHRWLRDPDVHAVADGIPVGVIPHLATGAPRHTDVPLRDFEVGLTGKQLIEHGVDEHPLIVVILTDGDEPRDHLYAGIAMMRLMVQADLLGLASCPMSQAVDYPAFRARLQGRMGWIGRPQMMLRIGHPASPIIDLPRTPRRPAAEVLDVAPVV